MPVDVFANLGKSSNELHPQFVHLRELEAYGPARGVLREVEASFEDPDGNFVEQFQTTGFDARTFELFLFSMFRGAGHAIDRSHGRPDFVLSNGGVTVAVEAVTASEPAVGGVQPYFLLPPDRSAEELLAYMRDNVPIRLGSPLYTKLKQRYWLEPHVAKRPFVIAIQDFSGPGSLLHSSTPLSRYLNGFEQCWYHDDNGRLIITEEGVDSHVVGAKRIPSGFFYQPDVEHISAILFCNTGTIAKFNRIGQEGQYRSSKMRMIRFGVCYRHDADAAWPLPFAYEVGDLQYGRETWRQGTVLIRNPKAKYPLPDEWLGAAVEENVVQGKVVSTFAEQFVPYRSITQTFPGSTSDQEVEAIKQEAIGREESAQRAAAAIHTAASRPKS